MLGIFNKKEESHLEEIKKILDEENEKKDEIIKAETSNNNILNYSMVRYKKPERPMEEFIKFQFIINGIEYTKDFNVDPTNNHYLSELFKAVGEEISRMIKDRYETESRKSL